MTGLFNRRKLEHDLRLYYESYVRHAVPTSICMFDLDNLKKVNDSQGHHVGDELIQAAARLCIRALEGKGTACRLGGDEFVVLLPNTGCNAALQWAQQLRGRFNQGLHRFAIDNRFITVSIGVTTMLSGDASFEDALRRVDRALYEAKNLGKNRVVLV